MASVNGNYSRVTKLLDFCLLLSANVFNGNISKISIKITTVKTLVPL